MTTAAIVGLCLQLLGTGITGWALWSEWGDRSPKVKPPARPRVVDPWEGPWRTQFPKVWDSERRDYLERVRDERRGSGRSVGSDPELIGLGEWMVGIFRETRSDLSEDWRRQERGSSDLHEATVALFESMQAAHRATRRRVLVEMTGLASVTVGTVISTL